MKNIKKLLLLVSILTLTFVLAGCGKSKDVKPEFKYTEYSEEQLLNSTVSHISQYADFAMNSDDTASKNEFLLSLKAYENLDSDYKTISNGVDQFENIVDECGEFLGFDVDEQGHYKYSVNTTKKAATFTLNLKFEKRDVKATFKYEESTLGDIIPTAITFEPNYSMGEKMGKAGINTITGMGVVIVMLAFLSVVISLFKFINILDKKLKNRSKKTDDVVVEKSQSVVAENVEDDTELVAVITAAIAQYEASQGASGDGFVVRSIKRVSNSKWNKR